MKNYQRLLLIIAITIALLGLDSCNRVQSCEGDQVGILEVLEKPYKLSGQYSIRAHFYVNQTSVDFENDTFSEIYGKLPKKYTNPGKYYISIKLIPKNICGSYHPCIYNIYKISCVETLK